MNPRNPNHRSRRLLHPLIIGALFVSATAHAAIESRDSWTDTFEVSTLQPELELSNVWGDVRVRPGPDGMITVQVTEHRSAPDQARYDRSLEALKLRTKAGSDGVSMYVGGPDPDRWRHSDRCKGCRVEYRFEVTVPRGTRLDVSTVNDGKVDVEGVTGMIRAGNVNGPIAISGLHDCSELNNVNGEVALSFARAPAQDCEIETINGDVVLGMPEGAGLDVAMDLFNGRMRSELPVDALALPARVKHTQLNGRHQYQIEQSAGLRIAGGGPTFTISSMNGDIRIKTNP